LKREAIKLQFEGQGLAQISNAERTPFPAERSAGTEKTAHTVARSPILKL
jgi:hypothetical protein